MSSLRRAEILTVGICELEEKVLLNVKRLINPYLEKLDGYNRIRNKVYI